MPAARCFEGLGLYLSLAGFLVGSFLGQMLYALGGSLIRTALIDNPDLDVINRISGGLLYWLCGVAMRARFVWRLTLCLPGNRAQFLYPNMKALTRTPDRVRSASQSDTAPAGLV